MLGSLWFGCGRSDATWRTWQAMAARCDGKETAGIFVPQRSPFGTMDQMRLIFRICAASAA